MPRDRNPALVKMSKPADGVVGAAGRSQCLRDRNARTAAATWRIVCRGEPTMMIASGRRDARLPACDLPRGVVARLRQDHGVAERLQLVRQALHGIGEDQLAIVGTSTPDRAGAGHLPATRPPGSAT